MCMKPLSWNTKSIRVFTHTFHVIYSDILDLDFRIDLELDLDLEKSSRPKPFRATGRFIQIVYPNDFKRLQRG